ncbi:MAG: hypothetical protein M1830_000253 [Pleopsidium flavum]|nr:MAG: hypothetical protein M1830_000253 [Pleopsidium flavum]
MLLSGSVKREKPLPKAKHSLRSRYKEMITVSVGGNTGEFHRFGVQKNLVCHYSTFFRAACLGQFREAESGGVKLPNESAETFDLFVHWLYTQKLDSSLSESLLTFLTAFIELYILAEKMQVPALRNCILDYMVSKADCAIRCVFPRRRFPTNADKSTAYAKT